jgi:hypothetical protein
MLIGGREALPVQGGAPMNDVLPSVNAEQRVKRCVSVKQEAKHFEQIRVNQNKRR